MMTIIFILFNLFVVNSMYLQPKQISSEPIDNPRNNVHADSFVKENVEAIAPELAIVYKHSVAYRLIWKDRGSGARMDGAFWSVDNYQSEYCSLGDYVTGTWSSPKDKAVLVTPKLEGALVQPTSFTKIWADHGSGAWADVTVYRMNAPEGYTCIGHVAVSSYTTMPNKQKYCCVKDQYLVQGNALFTWNDKGSGAKADFSAWTIYRAHNDDSGVNSANFLGMPNYNRANNAYLLKGDGVTVMDIWNAPAKAEKDLKLFEVSELKWIWDDAWSGSNVDCSIWRPERRSDDYFPLGDIVVATYRKPTIGYLLKVKAGVHNVVRNPVSYSRVWRDTGSGAKNDVSLWKVHCPSSFVSLGYVATSGAYPSVGDVFCVNSKYASPGEDKNWAKIWNDKGSGARTDVSIMEAEHVKSNEQSVRGFGAVTSYDYNPEPIWMLKKDSINYWAEKPIDNILMYNVIYDIPNEKVQTSPQRLSSQETVNNANVTTITKLTISYHYDKKTTFSFSTAIQVGVSVSLNAGIPMILNTKSTISASTTNTFQTSSSLTSREGGTLTQDVPVLPHHKVKVWIAATHYQADIPYTADIKKTYFDGSISYAKITGVCKDSDIAQFGITVGTMEPIPEIN